MLAVFVKLGESAVNWENIFLGEQEEVLTATKAGGRNTIVSKTGVFIAELSHALSRAICTKFSAIIFLIRLSHMILR